MVGDTAAKFAARDIQKAVDWAISQPADTTEAVIFGVASDWAKSDPATTGEWIPQLHPGAVRNATILALVAQLEKTDPDAARQWRASITN